MASFNQRNITEFRSRLSGGGARSNLFEVEIAFPEELNITISDVSDKIPFLVKAAEIPASNLGNIPVPYRGRVLPVAGDRTFDPWTVTIINDTDFAVRDSMERWANGINNHKANTGLTNPTDYQADLLVEQLDRDESVIKTYNFRGCFPVNIAAIELNYETVDTIEEFTVEFAIQYWESNSTT